MILFLTSIHEWLLSGVFSSLTNSYRTRSLPSCQCFFFPFLKIREVTLKAVDCVYLSLLLLGSPLFRCSFSIFSSSLQLFCVWLPCVPLPFLFLSLPSSCQILSLLCFITEPRRRCLQVAARACLPSSAVATRWGNRILVFPNHKLCPV